MTQTNGEVLSPPKVSHIIIFGAGSAGIGAFEYITQVSGNKVIAFVDNDSQKHGSKLNDLPIISPDELVNYDYDKVIIASMYWLEIELQLQELGLKADKYSVVSLKDSIGFNLGEGATQALARELLLGICHELTQADIEHYIDHGTLLGIVRDGDLLPWDNDIDLATSIDNQQTAYSAAKKFTSNFTSRHCSDNRWDCELVMGKFYINDERQELPISIKIENKADDNTSNGLHVDLVLTHKRDELIYWYVGGVVLSAPRELLQHFKSHEFAGKQLSIPVEEDRYLTHLYGDWRTPVKDWLHVNYTNIHQLPDSKR